MGTVGKGQIQSELSKYQLCRVVELSIIVGSPALSLSFIPSTDSKARLKVCGADVKRYGSQAVTPFTDYITTSVSKSQTW